MARTTFKDFPLSARNRAWDAGAADTAVRKWASSDGSGNLDKIDWTQYAQAFFWQDGDATKREQVGGYKLPFCTAEDGKLLAVWSGITHAGGRVDQTDIPTGDVAGVKNHIAEYYTKAAKEYADQSIEVPWKATAASLNPDALTRVGRAIGAGLAEYAGLAPGLPAPAAAASAPLPVAPTPPASGSRLSLLIAGARARSLQTTARQANDGRMRLRLSAESVTLERAGCLLSLAEVPPADPGPVADPTPTVTAADPYWLEQRQKLGLVEDHVNALYAVIKLVTLDKPVNNGFNDIIPTAEGEKALASLLLQPVDMSPEMDQHERERLSGMGCDDDDDDWWFDWFCDWRTNGIFGAIYGARVNAGAIEIGAALWAADFPDKVDQVVTFRASLGASFDLLCNGMDSTMNTNLLLSTRTLRDITFLGGCILVKTCAADPSTWVGDLRYGGESVEDLLAGGYSMAGEANANQGNTVAALASAQQTALAAVQAQVAERDITIAARNETITALTTERDNARLAETNAAERTRLASAAQQTAEQERDALQAELDQLRADIARNETVAARMQVLDTLATEFGGRLYDDTYTREVASTEIAELDDAAFETYRLTKENALLRTSTAAGTRRPTPVPRVPAALPRPGTLLGSTAAAPGDSDLAVPPPGGTLAEMREFGRGFAVALRGKDPNGAGGSGAA